LTSCAHAFSTLPRCPDTPSYKRWESRTGARLFSGDRSAPAGLRLSLYFWEIKLFRQSWIDQGSPTLAWCRYSLRENTPVLLTERRSSAKMLSEKRLRAMKLGEQDYFWIKEPDSTSLRVARQPYQCCGGHNGESGVPRNQLIRRGELYVEHWDSRYHPECAIERGLIERVPIRSCPQCHRFICPGQPHADTCPTTGTTVNQRLLARAAGATG